MPLTALFYIVSSLWSLSLLPLLHGLRITNQNLSIYLEPQYDYIVVGGGISGLVVANRLSEDEATTILLIEAGDLNDPQSMVEVPGLIGVSNWREYDWNLTTANQSSLDGKTRPYNLGRVVGGSSVVNGLCWTRGSRSDYDGWEKLGNPGWGWKGMLPYFKKVENYTANISWRDQAAFSIHGDPSTYGTTGPVQVAYPQWIYNQSQNVLRGLAELGIPTLSEPNNGSSLGAFLVPSSLSPDNQTRSDARTAYYEPAVSRPNLHVATGQRVKRLRLGERSRLGGLETGGRSIMGVENEFATGPSAQTWTVRCNKEVILAAGAVFSSVLLQVSGIGPAQVLNDLKIPVKIDLPGVGNNFQDHPMASVSYTYTNTSLFTSLDIQGVVEDDARRDYYGERTGPWTAPLVNTLAFPAMKWITPYWRGFINHTRSQRPEEHLPPDLPPTVRDGYATQRDIILSELEGNRVAAYELLATSWGQISVSAQKPLSRGTVRPSTRSIFSPPAIDPRYCSDPLDCAILLLGLRLNQRLVRTGPMAELQPDVPEPFNASAYHTLMTALKPLVSTEFHPSGTTAMLPLELGGVVDPSLRVYGTCNLRVADAGVMPMIPAAHLQAAVYAVAEKAADIIKAASDDPGSC